MAPDFTAVKNTNVTFMCYSDEPITWRVPWFIDGKNSYGKFYEIHKEFTANIYKVQLNLFHVSHQYVGFYDCIKYSAETYTENDETLFRNMLASKIYLFVEGRHVHETSCKTTGRITKKSFSDPENSVFSSTPSYVFGQLCDFYIPCKPTSKNYTVELKMVRNSMEND